MNRIIAWGTYDKSKPRVRLLLGELRAQDALEAEINTPVWKSVRDKAVASPARLVATLFRLLASYPGSLIKLLRQPRGLPLLLPYPAIPDIFVAWPIARLRGHAIIFDAFISMHDTIVSDRVLISAGGLASKSIWLIEKLALSLADVILVDTDQHADFFSSEFGIQRDRFQTVLVGAEDAFWAVRDKPAQTIDDLPFSDSRPLVLFYGQLIPLHGIDTILQAIELTKEEPINWLLIGSGQEEAKVRHFLTDYGGVNVRWLPWIEYERLPAIITSATVALGIFGTSDKAARVIPNKAFQILAAGKPLITRASPAMDSVVTAYPEAVATVEAGNGQALANAIRESILGSNIKGAIPAASTANLGPSAGVKILIQRIAD